MQEENSNWREEEEDTDAMSDRYLTFRVGDEAFGIEIVYVTEIVGIQRVTEVPEMPGYMRGVINLRGKVIPVIDVRSRFGMDQRAYDDRTCIVVVELADDMVGLIVDLVNEVLDIPPEHVSPPPRLGAGGSAEYIKGMGKSGGEVKILLDVSKLLGEHELESITEVAKS